VVSPRLPCTRHSCAAQLCAFAPCRRLPSYRRERDFCRRRQAPQNLPKRRDLCAETQEPPSRSRKTGRIRGSGGRRPFPCAATGHRVLNERCTRADGARMAPPSGGHPSAGGPHRLATGQSWAGCRRERDSCRRRQARKKQLKEGNLAQRPKAHQTKSRKWLQKTAFLLADFNVRVSES
jgi:hypothetical protein